MPKKIQKSLQDYISNIKKPNPKFHCPIPSNISLSSSQNCILSGCKHPKTLSFASGRNQQNDDSATLSDVDRFLFENFKSLYNTNDNDIIRPQNDNNSGSVVLFESPRLLDTPPNLRGSHRFFVTPGISGSLIEEARTSSSSSAGVSTNSNDVASSLDKTTSFSSETLDDNDFVSATLLPEQCVAVLANSSDPYDDFRRSMTEMVGARLRRREKVDWGFMEELLFCYLDLNDKKSYKYILGAFVDLVVDLRRDSDHPVPTRSRKVVRTSGTREREKEKEVLRRRRSRVRDE